MQIIDWDKYPNFSKEEFDCKETGENNMQPDFLTKLQELRTLYGKPIIITSGFRSVKHSIEKKKAKGGYHTQGIACDIGCDSQQAYDLVKLAYLVGFTGIRVSQAQGKPRFIHLDLRPIGERHLGSY